MKHIIPAIALLTVSCTTPAPVPSPSSSAVRYRYANTLNLGNDLTMDEVTVTGYDDENLGESTRLEVTVNKTALTLRSDTTGGMFTPSVEAGPGGTLNVAWGEIDDGSCKVQIAQNPDGSLKVLSRKQHDYSAPAGRSSR